MAENAQTLPAVITGGFREFNGMPAGRQLALLGMLAGAIVVIVAVLYWAFRPTYVPLFPRMESEEAAEVVQALSQAGISYEVDSTTGQVKVPQGDVAEARLQLASEGLPRSGDVGFELLQEDTGLGTSRMIEGARFHRAMEGELARTVASLDAVERARVHIAQAEESVFVRDRRPASASVVVHLRGSRSLSDSQVSSIVHLVASSTSELEPESVTVVDQRGRLLTQDGAIAVAWGIVTGSRTRARSSSAMRNASMTCSHRSWARTRCAFRSTPISISRSVDHGFSMLAQRLDIAEELDRIDGHVKAVREILGNSGPSGRRLDFLMQEFNRETNTLASKSHDLEITRATVEMKVLVEQMREQVQNLE